MIVAKDNNGKPTGLIETLVSNVRVATINQAGQVTTATTRDRANGQVKTETFFGSLPLMPKD